ncbi:CPBP family intramembrane metalloprotease [Haloarcula sp. S1CR25-12]|uniref:CPBP family intramembrane metalloprotease n=1 Tax=Haloarcula saliterrae TaxID=2950534 RepID=A0ABU2FCB2_9EURY|nr:type II CAAX endopeptidase family protein [Haloarcula sp. S1CR25-12]MDS0259856.1 CPBP family intramembrane metalloprotease [Haloarcula sp. S1CR25-12]
MATDSSDGRLAGLAHNYPAGTYFVLAIALSWAVWLPALSALSGPRFRLVAVVPGAFGPLAAAAVVTRLRGGTVRAWLGDAVIWPPSRRWTALAVVVPVGIALALVAVAVALTGEFAPADPERALALFGVNVVFASLLGGGQEEFGWRGFALPHLQARFDALTASLIVGAVWALWHAPMFYFGVYGEQPALYAAGVLAYAIVFTWYYNSSGGDLLGVVVMHGTLNAAAGLLVMLVGESSSLPVPYEALLAAGFWTVALAVLVRHGRETLASGAAIGPDWSEPGPGQHRPAATRSPSGDDD